MNLQPQLHHMLVAKGVVDHHGTRDLGPVATAYLIECMRHENITQLDATVTVDERRYKLRVEIHLEPA